MKQIDLNLYKGTKGGRRPGPGRKRLHSPGVAHRAREKVSIRQALHINFKVTTFIRNKECLQVLNRAIRNARSHGLKILHFSLESNHIHLIVESTNNSILTRGMRSLTITFAKGVRKGRIQFERYHLHVLRTIRETRNAIHYVLFNHQKHRRLKKAYINQYSSLGLVKDLRSLAKASNFTVILRGRWRSEELDPPRGWIIRQALHAV